VKILPSSFTLSEDLCSCSTAATAAAMDPFRAVQDEVTASFNSVQADIQKWQKLSTKSPKHEPMRQRIMSRVSELQVDLQDMQATIDIALKDPTKFALTPSELMARQSFVRDLQAHVNDSRDLLEPTPAAAGRLAAKAAVTNADRSDLFASRAGAAESGGTKRDQAAWADNEATLQQQQQHREAVIDNQDQELGVLGNALDRLGAMSKVINEELKTQGKELDALGGDMDQTSSKMKQAEDIMKKMLKQKDRGKFCAIFVLSVVLILLLYAVVAW
jgi:hypothetical protein